MKSATALERIKITDHCCLWNKGVLSGISLLLAPGTVRAALKTTAAMRVATSIQELAVPLIALSPPFSNSLWVAMKTSLGVFPALFLANF